jgi:TRAP-type mannitol/chloroaromatic compound transport system substrate-binding protein
MNYSKVTGHSNLIRDEETKAIINTNMSDYNNYIMQKRAKEKESQKIRTIENEVANIREDLDEIKNLLRKISNET